MGKASRSKRERREQATAVPIEHPGAARRLPVFWIVIALFIVAGLAAIVITAPDKGDDAAKAAAAKVPAFADVTVQGDDLATWDGTGTDEAIGEQVPTISGTDFDGMRRTLANNDGIARAYVVVAHWCPHCRAEVPRLVTWAKEHELPAGVEVVAVSTSVDDGQPNFPPAAWLAEEEWPFRVIADDEVGTAAAALGVEGFPFLVFADQHGIVQQRFSGEMPIGEFGAAIEDITPTAPKAAA